jgi:hypothetical protein
MNEIEKILNKGHQRAGLLAVVTGVLQTSDCEATKKSIIGTLEHIFDDYPVGDDVERMTKRAMALDQKNDAEDKMEEMLKKLMDMLKN